MTPRRAKRMLSDRVKKLCSGCGSATRRAPCLASVAPEIRSLVTGEPQRLVGHHRIGAADHLELQVRDDLGQRHDREIDEVAGAVAAGLFAAEEREDDRSLRPRPFGQRFRQHHHRHRPRRVVVSAIVDTVGAGPRPAARRCDRDARSGRWSALRARDRCRSVAPTAFHVYDDGAVLVSARRSPSVPSAKLATARVGCLVEVDHRRSRRRSWESLPGVLASTAGRHRGWPTGIGAARTP